MKKEIVFRGTKYFLEMAGALEVEKDFQKFPAKVATGAQILHGSFRLPRAAVELLNRRAAAGKSTFEELWMEGCARALQAELFIRPLGEGFTFVVDQRFFEGPG
jgi:hypothetical protein